MGLTDTLAKGLVFVSNKKKMIVGGATLAGIGIAVAVAGVLKAGADKIESSVETEPGQVEETVEPTEVPVE
jgi:hypothetical protein